MSLAIVIVVLVPVQVVAHPKSYVGAVTDGDTQVVVCDGVLGVGIGGVCFPANHVAPNPNGVAILWVQDVSATVGGVVSAFACHRNGDVCNGWAFCQSLTLQTSKGWNPSLELIVAIDGPVYGSPVDSLCQWNAPQGSIGSPPFPGLTGDVFHF